VLDIYPTLKLCLFFDYRPAELTALHFQQLNNTPSQGYTNIPVPRNMPGVFDLLHANC
jgi:hypothetical protein